MSEIETLVATAQWSSLPTDKLQALFDVWPSEEAAKVLADFAAGQHQHYKGLSNASMLCGVDRYAAQAAWCLAYCSNIMIASAITCVT